MCYRHIRLPLDVEFFGLLGGMSMLSACVHFQLLEHGAAKRALRKHAFYGLLNDLLGSLVNQLLEVDGFDSTRKAGMAVIHLC